MPFYGQRKYDHAIEINKPCCKICGKPFLMYWKDKDEKNGFSDTVTHIAEEEWTKKIIVSDIHEVRDIYNGFVNQGNESYLETFINH